MPLRTQQFSMIPWIGGVNTSIDPSIIPPNQVIQADNVVFGTQGSKKQRAAINHNWDSATNGGSNVIGLSDFWFGMSNKTQRLVSVLDDKTIFSYILSTGVRSADLFGGSAWASSITRVSFEALNNLLIIAVDGTGNVLKKWSGAGSTADLGGTPPVASFCRQHLGRIFCNDKANSDRLHYSETGNPEIWNGTGDSGAIDIGIGDGDPEGITAIFPTFKGDLFIAKRTKLYRLTGYTPESFSIELVSSGVGCISHNSVVLADQDDIYFISEKGCHSLGATAKFGDFEGAFVSADIQKTFNDNWVKNRLKYIYGVYLSTINSIAFTVTDSSISSTENKTLWLYNIAIKAWYRWPNISCSSLTAVSDSDQRRFFIGTNQSRVSKSFHSTNFDISNTGTNSAILYTVKSGIIFVDRNPYTLKGFKRFSLLYRPEGSHTITATLKIDNYSNQAVTFTQNTSVSLLGSTFILGTSTLGLAFVLAPYTNSIDGYGRGIQITLNNSGTDSLVDIQGFVIEYEPAGIAAEVILSEA